MTTYEQTFKMSQASDNAAALVFELGLSAEDVVIDNVVLTEVRSSQPAKYLQIDLGSEGKIRLVKTPYGSIQEYDASSSRSVRHTYVNNTPVTVEALNNARNVFKNWLITHEDLSQTYSYENPMVLTIDENVIVSAVFTARGARNILHAINCGGQAYIGADSIKYLSDRYYTGGSQRAVQLCAAGFDWMQ
jgi:hypothetical protein